MRTLLIVVLVLCVASVTLARRQHKKHHRKNWPRMNDQVPQPSPYYEPDVYYNPPISSDDNQNTNDGWENSDDWTKVEQGAPAVDDGWSNVRQEAPVDDGWSNPAVDPVDPGFENPEVVNPAPVDDGWSNPAVDPVDPGFENPEVVDPVPVDEAWGNEEVNQNAWVEEREQPEVAEPEDPSEVDWQEAQQERKPWFDEQVEIRHEKPYLEEYDDGFEEEPVEAIDDIDMAGVDSFDDTDGENVDDITEEDLWDNRELDKGLDTSEELYGDESESAEYSSETSEENMDTSEELYGADSESQGYSSETSEEDIYGKRDRHDDWNGQEVDNDAEEDKEADILWQSTTPADIGEPEAVEVLRQRWRAFTAWHYAFFAVAGAVVLVAFMIVVVTAIRACRYRKPMYRRLETEKLPVAV